jgi:cytoskeletal protein CcmA (bactofilin family)
VLTLADIVSGDDVTVYGYALSGGTIVARKITVHRRLLAVDGTVASITDQSFVLTAADGPHTVLISGATAVLGPVGTVLAAGMKVHVTGYLRGDGIILATRVRIVKAA